MGRRGARRRRRDGGVRRRGDPRRFEGDVAFRKHPISSAARAVLENDAETLRRLLASRAVSPDAADERGDTLLSLSCGLGRRGATKALLRAGADLNAKNAAGVAPVERCVEEGHFELADFLVKWAERHGVRMGDE